MSVIEPSYTLLPAVIAALAAIVLLIPANVPEPSRIRTRAFHFLAAILAALVLCCILPTAPHLTEALPAEPQLLEHVQIEASAASFTSTLLAVACGLKLMAISAVEVIVPVVGYPYGSIFPPARHYSLPITNPYLLSLWECPRPPQFRGWYTTFPGVHAELT